MTNKRDNFDKTTIEALAKRSAYVCSNPDCKSQTIAPSSEDDNKFIYTGKAAHITASSKGGPRYDSKINTEERKSIKNGIFLCSNCADMIDKNDGIDFPTHLLNDWKSSHESWARKNLNKRIDKVNEEIQNFIVTSHHQQGGITAGVVNVGHQPRELNDELRSQLSQLLTDKSKTVTVTSVLGDGEAFGFANQIKDYLLSQSYDVNGVNQAVFSKPIIGQSFDPKTLTLNIGTKQ